MTPADEPPPLKRDMSPEQPPEQPPALEFARAQRHLRLVPKPLAYTRPENDQWRRR